MEVNWLSKFIEIFQDNWHRWWSFDLIVPPKQRSNSRNIILNDFISKVSRGSRRNGEKRHYFYVCERATERKKDPKKSSNFFAFRLCIELRENKWFYDSLAHNWSNLSKRAVWYKCSAFITNLKCRKSTPCRMIVCAGVKESRNFISFHPSYRLALYILHKTFESTSLPSCYIHHSSFPKSRAKHNL